MSVSLVIPHSDICLRQAQAAVLRRSVAELVEAMPLNLATLINKYQIPMDYSALEFGICILVVFTRYL